MTSLTEQLKKVSLAIGRSPGSRRNAPSSLLYSSSEASETGTQTILDNAREGLNQLAQVDPRFFAYGKSLFNPHTVLAFDRAKLTSSQLDDLNKSISAFLRLLGPHFLRPACFKTLEYLLRKYKVHMHNVDELISFALPFHGTNQFVRMVQVAQVETSSFAFLRGMQQSGAALPREGLVQQCLRDRALLRLICEQGKIAGSRQQQNRFMVTLYGVLVCELLMASLKVDEDVVRLLLPFLLHGVSSGTRDMEVSEDYRAATLMIIVQLCSVATLAQDFLAVLLQQITQHAGKGEDERVLRVLCQVATTQPQLKKLPKSVITVVSKMSGAPAFLDVLRQKGAPVKPLLKLLLTGCCSHIAGSNSCCAFLIQLTEAMDLGSFAAYMAAEVIKRATKPGIEETHSLQRVMRSLDAHYPEEVDGAVNEALQAAGATGTAERERIASFLTLVLSHSARALLPGEGLTTALAIDSPSPQLRIQAVKQLDALMETESETAFIHSSVLRRLSDEDPQVLEAVLSGAAVKILPAEQLAESLSTLLRRCQAVLDSRGLDKAARKGLREAIRKALKVLVETSVPSTADRAAAELLNFALATPPSKRVSLTVAKLAARMDHPVLAGFKGTASHDADEEIPQPSTSKEQVAAGNQVAVNSLSTSLIDTPPQRVAAIAGQLTGLGRHLLLMALNIACRKGSVSAAQSTLRAAAVEWSAAGEVMRDASPIDDVDSFGADGGPSLEYLGNVASLFGKTRKGVLQRALLAAIPILPDRSTEEWHRIFVMLMDCQPGEAFKPHLEAIVERTGAKATALLSNFLALPPGHIPVDQQVVCLGLLATQVLEKRQDVDTQQLFPQLLAAATNPDVRVRSAALEALRQMLQAEEETKQGSAKSDLRVVVEGIVNDEARILGIFDDQAEAPAAVQSLWRVAGTLEESIAAPSKGVKKITVAAKKKIIRFLLDALEGQTGLSGIYSAEILLCGLRRIAPRGALITSAAQLTWNLLEKYEAGPAKLLSSNDPIFIGLALQVLSLFDAREGWEGAAASKDQIPTSFLAHAIAPSSESSQPAFTPELKSAALEKLTPELYAVLDDEGKLHLLAAALVAASGDPNNAVRTAAHAVLERLPLGADVICAFLASAQPIGDRRRAKRVKGQQRPSVDSNRDPRTHGHEPKVLQAATLELLQWKANLGQSDLLLEPLSARLKDVLGHREDWETSADYILQLALNAMLQNVSANPESPRLVEVDVATVMECTGGSFSGATRNAALSLLATLATLIPEQTLGVTLQVITAVGFAAQSSADAESQDIAVATMKAVTPAWLAAGKGLNQLAQAAIDSTRAVLQTQALPLLSAFVSSVPDGRALQTVLLILLERLAEGGEEPLHTLASPLTLQVSSTERMAAFSGLLRESLAISGDKPHRPLCLLATAFVATELRRPGTVVDAQGHESLQQILSNGLHQLQLLAMQGGRSPSKPHRQAMLGAMDMMAGLEGTMQPAVYVSKLLEMLQCAEDSIKTRALRLFDAALERGSDRQDADASMQFCSKVSSLLAEGSSVATKRAALLAFRSLAAAHGKQRPKDILEAVPIVLEQLTQSTRALRCAALTALSSVISALGTALLPVVPRLVPAVLSAALAATQDDVGNPGEDGADKPASDTVQEEGPAEESSKHRLRQTQEAEAALAAVGVLVDSLGHFLSPHLGRMLVMLLQETLVDPGNLMHDLGADVRDRLAKAIPARLLLPALFEHLEAAIQEGSSSTQELVKLATSVVEGMKPSEAMLHAEALWVFILRVLDLRQAQPPSITSVQPVEDTAVELLIKVTLKLSEVKFKPLFLRLLDWAATTPLTGAEGPQRQIVLFKVVNALAQNLRGIFVPYYRYILELIVAHLGGAPNKKPKRQKVAPRAVQTHAESALLRLQVVRAVHCCCLYDTEGFLSEHVFHRLLSPLVSQLGGELPEDVVAAEVPPNERPDSEAVEEGLDVMGKAVVDALVQMAVGAGKDGPSKSLHHQVLMASRSEASKQRRRSLEVICQLVERLGEEYIPLLPEAMPFLAELLEDSEQSIQNKTRALLRTLEGLTGENLDDFLKV